MEIFFWSFEWTLTCELLSTLRGCGRNQDTAGGWAQATGEGWRIAGRTSRDTSIERAMELANRSSIYKRSESLMFTAPLATLLES